MGRKSINVSEYREVDCLSYSALSAYNKNPLDYYNKYILKTEIEETENIRLGKLLDIKITDPDNFDNYFVLAKAPTPAPQMVRFCQLLLEEYNPEDGIETGLRLAYNRLDAEKTSTKLQKNFESMVTSFNDTAKEYFQELLESKTKTLVNIEEATISEEIFKKWKQSKQFQLLDGEEEQLKFPIYGNIGDEEFKCEIDRLIWNHEKKYVKPRDLKITGFVEDFFIQRYLKLNYYLQQGIYTFLLRQWMDDNGFKEYKIENFGFEVLDSSNKLQPLLYICEDDYYQQSWEGFYWGNKYYKGVIQLISELNKSKELNVWNISIKNLTNGGIVYMPKIEEWKDI